MHWLVLFSEWSISAWSWNFKKSYLVLLLLSYFFCETPEKGVINLPSESCRASFATFPVDVGLLLFHQPSRGWFSATLPSEPFRTWFATLPSEPCRFWFATLPSEPCRVWFATIPSESCRGWFGSLPSEPIRGWFAATLPSELCRTWFATLPSEPCSGWFSTVPS